jgi:hypothetical protein
MTAQMQSGSGLADDRQLARARTMRVVSIILAIVAFSTLVVGFGLGWQAYYQVPAGLAAWACIEWQRACGRKIKELTEAGVR